MSWYSICITPDDVATAEVKVLKDLLRSQIGWYASCNSSAHISFTEFEANEAQIGLVKSRLKDFCRQQSNSEVIFNRVQFWKSGTLCLLPDEVSKGKIEQLMKAFTLFMGIRGSLGSPHMSIGRKLENVKMNEIVSFWETKQISIQTPCNNLTIRELDKSQGQFKVYQKILFGDEQS